MKTTMHMYRFVCCLLFAATYGVAATTAPTTAPSVGQLIYLNSYQNIDCTGNPLQTTIHNLNTCSCNANTATSSHCPSYTKITRDPISYSMTVYSDNSCQMSTGSMDLGDGSCNDFRMRTTTDEVPGPPRSVLICGPNGCNYPAFATNSASTISTIASIGVLALIGNVIYTNFI